MNPYTQNQNPSVGAPLSALKQKIDAGANIADKVSQSILPYARSELGYSAVSPAALVGLPLAFYFLPGVVNSFVPFGLIRLHSGGLSPLMLFLCAGAAMGLLQRRRCWNDLNAGILRNGYSAGLTRSPCSLPVCWSLCRKS
jgi:hypothetical protein